ncbi:cbb3-type cytochrome oxidase assembly protein CcoS [Pseudorhodobacter wandonensis]|jgi:cbb3-type cytochrome oxidase maturation protein|uniref:cbb3-type cytochrome oxidase assembly protein CcoS n=1 Tax=Pseudorhodobacter wandonensis TaxID=1120568 RepID=UPI00067E47FE|nr:cbb3-type cytochrome oxidase assembly protein CcoS [Pseudorhodobacter wandonensis]
MNYYFLIPVSIGLGLTGLAAFFWAMRHNQYEDLDGAAARVLNAPDKPLTTLPAKDTTHG